MKVADMGFYDLATGLQYFREDSSTPNGIFVSYIDSQGQIHKVTFDNYQSAEAYLIRLHKIGSEAALYVNGKVVRRSTWNLPTGRYLMVNEATTEANIAYVPSQIGAVRSRLKKLAQSKTNWNIEVLESAEGFTVRFEEALTVDVPGNYWSEFQRLMNSNLSSKTIQLQHLLDEDIDEEPRILEQLHDELSKTLRTFYKREEFQRVFDYVDHWRRIWPKSKFIDLSKNVRVQFQNGEKDILHAEDDIFAGYSDDRGGLEMVIDALKTARSISAYEGFKGYDFLYGTRLASPNVGVLEVLVDPALQVQVNINITNQDLADKVEEDYPQLKHVGSVFFPPAGEAMAWFKKIRETEEDLLTTKESPEQEQGENNA